VIIDHHRLFSSLYDLFLWSETDTLKWTFLLGFDNLFYSWWFESTAGLRSKVIAFAVWHNDSVRMQQLIFK